MRIDNRQIDSVAGFGSPPVTNGAWYARRLLAAAFVSVVLLASACSDSGTNPQPVQVDMTRYYVTPSPGFNKTYTDLSNQLCLEDTVFDAGAGDTALKIEYTPSGDNDFWRTRDRAWLAQRRGSSGDFHRFVPPLPTAPTSLPFQQEFSAQALDIRDSAGVLDTTIAVWFFELLDTALVDTVPAGIFDSVVLVRLTFLAIDGVDSSAVGVLRWYAPGVDEIRQRNVAGPAEREFDYGTINGMTYP